MLKDEDFDRWWAAQDPKPQVQKGTLRRGWKLGTSEERSRIRRELYNTTSLEEYDILRICPREEP